MTPSRAPICWAVRCCETDRRDVVQAPTVAAALVAASRLLGTPVELVEVAPLLSRRAA